MNRLTSTISWLVLLLGAVVLAGCPSVPKESVELSNTVGRDLEEIHRSHLALAKLQFDEQIERANKFIDDTYRPAFIGEFAREFRLADRVQLIVENDPEKLLPILTRFVSVANERIEDKRTRLVEPIRAQRDRVIESIDTAYRQIQSAQAVVTGHLASIRDVREMQNEMLAETGLDGLPDRISKATARVSNGVSRVVAEGERLDRDAENAGEKIRELEKSIEAFRKSLAATEEE